MINIKISTEKIIFMGVGIISIVIIIFAITVFRSNLKLTKELQLTKEEIMNKQTDDKLNMTFDESHETIKNDKENENSLKDTMIENIRERSERNVKEVMELEAIKGGDSVTLEKAMNNMMNKLLNSLIVFLTGMEKVSGYLALVFIIIGSIGTALSGKAPFVKKGFIGLIVLGPVIFIVSNYGPVLLSLL